MKLYEIIKTKECALTDFANDWFNITIAKIGTTNNTTYNNFIKHISKQIEIENKNGVLWANFTRFINNNIKSFEDFALSTNKINNKPYWHETKSPEQIDSCLDILANLIEYNYNNFDNNDYQQFLELLQRG